MFNAIVCIRDPRHATRKISTMHYRRDVDGLRALAIIPVVLFHAGFDLFSGGFVGVDIFFVISGFVITSKLVDDLDHGRFSLRGFYARRIRRLLPAMAVTLAAVYAAGLLLLLPPALKDLGSSLLATIGFSANIYFWKNSGYFEVAAQTRPLLHMWSLAVEEQFYLFIPLLIALLHRRLPRLTVPVLLVLTVASLALSAAIVNVAPTANFFLLPTRAWELLAGVLLAVAPLPGLRHRPLREGAGLLAVALMLAPVFLYDDTVAFPGLNAVPPVAGAALAIYLGGVGTSAATRVLGHPWLVGIGLVSYSLYLLHWPLIVYTRTWLLRDPSALEGAILVLTSGGLAWASWRWIETPFRRGHGTGDRRVFTAATAALGSLAALGLVSVVTKGLPQRMPDYSPQAETRQGPGHWKMGTCFLENQRAADWSRADCIRTTGAKENALLWGDSFAAHYVVGLLDNAPQLTHNIVQYTFAGCPPVLSYRSFARPGCEGFNRQVLDVIRDLDIKIVVIAARWDQLRQRGLGGLAETIETIRALGPEVYVIGQSPMFAFDADTLNFWKAGRDEHGGASWYASFNRHINEEVQRRAAGANFIDPLPTFCRDGRCAYLRDGALLFNDYGHFSASGSDLAVRAYFPVFRRSNKQAINH